MDQQLETTGQQQTIAPIVKVPCRCQGLMSHIFDGDDASHRAIQVKEKLFFILTLRFPTTTQCSLCNNNNTLYLR